jgi:chorismate mutase
VPPVVRALRGATTVDEDTPDQVAARTTELLSSLLERNGVAIDDVISVLFTATPDVRSMFPATAARTLGFGAVPLLCATEIDVPGAMPRVVRVLVHLHTDRPRDALHHVYLHGTAQLRDDLPD